MIFIVKDEHNEQRDKVWDALYLVHLILTKGFQLIAKHVMNLHMNRPNTNGEDGDAGGEISLEKMKRYIAYCKASVPPLAAHPITLLMTNLVNAHHGCLLTLRRCLAVTLSR